MLLGKVVEDGDDAWDNEPDCNEEADTGIEIHESDLEDAEAVVAAVDRYKLCVETIGRGEYEGLAARHGDNNWLHEEGSKGALDGLREFCRTRSIVLAAAMIAPSLGPLESTLSTFEEGRNVDLFV